MLDVVIAHLGYLTGIHEDHFWSEYQ